MIKLFWNTHNQTTPDSNKPNSEDARNLKWGVYHKNSSNKWIYEILSKIQFQSIESIRK